MQIKCRCFLQHFILHSSREADGQQRPLTLNETMARPLAWTSLQRCNHINYLLSRTVRTGDPFVARISIMPTDRETYSMQSFPPWLVRMVVIPAGVGVTSVICPGCVDRHRGNRICEWTDDTTFRIDMSNPAHREHLVADAQLAEELAIRYADTEYARRFGGAKAHGGLLDGGRVRNDCMKRIVAAIEHNHAVTAEQVEFARAGRNPIFDSVVLLLFLPMYVVFARPACGLVENAVPAEAGIGRLLAFGVASAIVSALGLLSFQLWSAVMEGMRVGNPDGHMSSYRLARQPYWTDRNVAAHFVGGMVLFWLVAAWRRPDSGNRPYGVFSCDGREASVADPPGTRILSDEH